MGYRATELLKKSGKLTLPDEGAWVLFKGNPYASRGLRVTPALREVGVRHWDMYWAYNESCPWNMPSKGVREDNFDADAELDEIIMETNGITDAQLTWMSLHTPSSQLVRAWCGEVAVIKPGTITDLLESGQYEIVKFEGSNPVWDEEVRDIIGGLLIDGLSLQAAQAELVRAGEMKYDQVHMPHYFYRVVRNSLVWHEFCEEPEYEAWYAPKLKGVSHGNQQKRENDAAAV